MDTTMKTKNMLATVRVVVRRSPATEACKVPFRFAGKVNEVTDSVK